MLPPPQLRIYKYRQIQLNFENILYDDSGSRIFIFLIMFCLGKCQKWASTSRADTDGIVEMGLVRRAQTHTQQEQDAEFVTW